MTLFLVVFVVILLAVLGMAVGVLLGRAPIESGCARLRGEEGCDLCGSGTCRRNEGRGQIP